MPDDQRISVTGSSRGQPGELHELRIQRPVRWHYQPEGMLIELTGDQLRELGEVVTRRLADAGIATDWFAEQEAALVQSRLRWRRGRGR